MIMSKEFTDEEIADKLGLAKKTVQNRRYALRRYKRHTEAIVMTEKERQDLLLNKTKSLSDKEIAEILHVTPKSVSRMRSRIRVQMPDLPAKRYWQKPKEKPVPKRFDLEDTEEL